MNEVLSGHPGSWNLAKGRRERGGEKGRERKVWRKTRGRTVLHVESGCTRSGEPRTSLNEPGAGL